MRRSARLAAMTKILVDRPNRIVSLSEFVERFGAAKSTVSEDLAIIRDVFAKEGLGRIETLTGAAGGVRYVPVPTGEEVAAVVEELCAELSSPERILPGRLSLYLGPCLVPLADVSGWARSLPPISTPRPPTRSSPWRPGAFPSR